MVAGVTGKVTSTVDLAPGDLGEALNSMRLCLPQAQQAMQLSLTRLGQLSPVQVYKVDAGLEVFDGFKRLRAARELSWPKLRVNIHDLDATGAKVRMLCSNAGAGLVELEEAWLVRSLYREDRLNQPQIAMLLSRHKSWVCRRLVLAEGLSDELTAKVRLGLVSPRTAVELGRLPRGNQNDVTQIVTQRGLTTHQTAHLVQRLLAAPREQWLDLLERVPTPPPKSTSAPKGGAARRTPAEQIVADAWAMKRIASRLHARLLERSLQSLGEAACATVARELTELSSTLRALNNTINTRLGEHGASNAT